MKKIFVRMLCAVSVLAFTVSCYNDSELRRELNDHEMRLKTLEALVAQMNDDIAGLGTIVRAVDAKDFVTGVEKTPYGYTIHFSKSQPVTISNGTDGKDGNDGQNGQDGQTPVITVAQDTDGNWYWKLNGEWLLDTAGNKVKANGTDGQNGQDGAQGPAGQDGQDGQDGADGQDGQDGAQGPAGQDGKDGQDGQDGKDGVDGVTPKLKIEEGYWYVSVDNGATWEQIGPATAGGESLFESVEVVNNEVVFTFKNGDTIVIPYAPKFALKVANCDAVTEGEAIELPYEVVGYADGDDVVVYLSQVSTGLTATIGEARATSGTLTITPSAGFTAGLVVLSATNNTTGATSTQAVTLEAGVFNVSVTEAIEVDGDGGDVEFTVTTNYACEVTISEDWVSLVPATKTIKTNGYTFKVEANTGKMRTATITLKGGSYTETVTLVQAKGRNPEYEAFLGEWWYYGYDDDGEFKQYQLTLEELDFPNTYTVNGFGSDAFDGGVPFEANFNSETKSLEFYSQLTPYTYTSSNKTYQIGLYPITGPTNLIASTDIVIASFAQPADGKTTSQSEYYAMNFIGNYNNGSSYQLTSSNITYPVTMSREEGVDPYDPATYAQWLGEWTLIETNGKYTYITIEQQTENASFTTKIETVDTNMPTVTIPLTFSKATGSITMNASENVGKYSAKEGSGWSATTYYYTLKFVGLVDPNDSGSLSYVEGSYPIASAAAPVNGETTLAPCDIAVTSGTTDIKAYRILRFKSSRSTSVGNAEAWASTATMLPMRMLKGHAEPEPETEYGYDDLQEQTLEWYTSHYYNCSFIEDGVRDAFTKTYIVDAGELEGEQYVALTGMSGWGSSYWDSSTNGDAIFATIANGIINIFAQNLTNSTFTINGTSYSDLQAIPFNSETSAVKAASELCAGYIADENMVVVVNDPANEDYVDGIYWVSQSAGGLTIASKYQLIVAGTTSTSAKTNSVKNYIVGSKYMGSREMASEKFVKYTISSMNANTATAEPATESLTLTK